MAKLTAGAGFGNGSGRLGGLVLARTQDGMVARERPAGSSKRSPAQREHDARMRIVNLAWDSLTPEECGAWRAYAFGLAARNPQTGGLRVPSAYGLFVGLGSKFLQVHGGSAFPSLPPAGRFAGDLVSARVLGDGAAVLVTPLGTNAPGVLTEVTAQRLSGPNNLPRPKSYASRGFFAFEAGEPVRIELGPVGTWAFAIRFVESSSGRMTDLVPIGSARVAAWRPSRNEGR